VCDGVQVVHVAGCRSREKRRGEGRGKVSAMATANAQVVLGEFSGSVCIYVSRC
jgi:hypothetical protein